MEVQSLTGNGDNLVSADGGHIANGVMSTRISDGAPQEVAMDPSITTGTRKVLTWLDLAFLRDIGYETAQQTLEADFNGDSNVDAADLVQWQRDFGVSQSSDADNDEDSDGADFLVWQRQFGSGSVASTSTTTTVPEPGSGWLLVFASTCLWGRGIFLRCPKTG